MADKKIRRGADEKKGGYPAGNKPVRLIKPPPPSMSRPKSSDR